MRAERGTVRTMATAIFVAYVLVLQVFLGGLASGTHSGSAFVRDAFGQVLCLSTDHGVPSEPGGHTPDCCTAACQLANPGAAPPPPTIALARPASISAEALFPPPRSAAHLALPPGPHRARAPPLA